MGLFGNKVNVDKLLEQALQDYKNGKYFDCYGKVSQAATTGNGRAEFCLALLCFNDNVAKSDEQDVERYLEIIKKAVARKYQLAVGIYAKNLEDMCLYEELTAFCRENRKSDDSAAQYFVAKDAMLFYSDDDEAKMDEKTATAAAQKCLKAAQYEVSRLEKNDIAYAELQTYNPFGASADLYNRLGRAYMVNYLVCYLFSDNHTATEMRRYYNDAMKYLVSALDRFLLAKAFTIAIFANDKQLGDISLANSVMKQLEEAYDSLADSEKEAYEENYDKIWENYREFFDEAQERLANRGALCYDNSAVDKNDLSADNVLNAVSSWSGRQSEQTTITRTVYTIGNKRYTRGEFGYLYDEEGFKGNYRIDDYGRLYIGDSPDDIGYFNKDGLFIGK